jgi:hypothetical protein
MPLDSRLAPSVDIRGTVFYSPGKSNRVGHDRFLRHRCASGGLGFHRRASSQDAFGPLVDFRLPQELIFGGSREQRVHAL